MEYQARLRKRRRAVLADRQENSCRHAALGGSGARRSPRDRAARRAPSRPGRAPIGWCSTGTTRASSDSPHDGALDHLVFAGASAAIRDVMVGGRWAIKDGRHALEDPNWPRRFASSCGNDIDLGAAH